MLKNLKRNKQGVVFITVLIIIIVTMVLAVTALSLNISQIQTAENELRYIQGKTIADGAFARLFVSQFTAAPATTILDVEILGNTTFAIDVALDPLGAGPAGSSSIPLDSEVTF